METTLSNLTKGIKGILQCDVVSQGACWTFCRCHASMRNMRVHPSPSSVLGLPVLPHSSPAVIDFDGKYARRMGNNCLYGLWACSDQEETKVVAATMRNEGWIRWSAGWDAAARRGSAFGGRRWGNEFYLCVGVSCMLTGQCVSLFCTYSVATSDQSWKLNVSYTVTFFTCVGFSMRDSLGRRSFTKASSISTRI